MSRRAPSMSRCPRITPNYPRTQILQTPKLPQNGKCAGTLWRGTLSMLRLPGRFTTGELHHFCSEMQWESSQCTAVCCTAKIICLIIWDVFWTCCSLLPLVLTVRFAIVRDLSSHLPFGSYAEQGMHTKAPSRFFILLFAIHMQSKQLSASSPSLSLLSN